MSKVYFPNDHTPEEWRKMAQESHQRSADSFDRCDTDGYLSQWASDITGRLYSLCADVAEHGGMWDFPALADADGALIEGARQVDTRYGRAWVYDRDGRTHWFNPSRAQDEAKREAANLAKGYRLTTVRRRAGVVMASGDGGMASCYPSVIALRDE